MSTPVPVGRVVVIGTSAGGFAALRTVLGGLPADFPAAVFVVQHVGNPETSLAELLARTCKLPVVWGAAGQTLAPGTVYVAPRDRHLVMTSTHVDVSCAPRENFARPAIDVTLRAAAQAFGAKAAGVILTGHLNDGTAGMYALKLAGGTVIAQDPEEAEHPDMPQSVIRHVEVDRCLRLAFIADALVEFATDDVAAAAPRNAVMPIDQTCPIKAFICPECGGALARSRLGSLDMFD